jgi:hypothetical protein
MLGANKNFYQKKKKKKYGIEGQINQQTRSAT